MPHTGKETQKVARPGTKAGRIALIRANRELLILAAKRRKKRRDIGGGPKKFFGRKTKDPAKLAVMALQDISEANLALGLKDPVKRIFKIPVTSKLKQKVFAMKKKKEKKE